MTDKNYLHAHECVDLTGHYGKTIQDLRLMPDEKPGGAVVVRFGDGSGCMLYESCQECCETRWLHTDDDLPAFTGSVLVGAEVTEPTSETNQYCYVLDSQFLRLHTSAGTVVFANYNEHNGYYEGMVLVSEDLPPNDSPIN